MPATWKQYGVDANEDGSKDPYNPVDAIFAAARYLKAAGAEQDLRKAIFAYNHADWYVDSVLMRARVIGGLPVQLRRLAHRADPGPLPRRRQGDLRRRPLRARGQEARQALAQDRATVHWWSRVRSTAAGSTSSPAAARPVIAVNDGKIVAHRRDQAPRPVRPAPGRLRQHLHVRAPGQGRQDLPARRASARRRARQVAARARAAAKDAEADRARLRRPTEQRAQAQGRREGQPQQPRAPRRQPRPQPPSSPRSACSRNPLRPHAAAPAASSRSSSAPARSTAARASRPTSRRSSASTARTSRSRRCAPARASSPARSSAASARPERAGPAPALRDPPRRPRRPADRPEADPRRLEAARVDRDLPRRRQEPVLRPGRQDARRSARSC